MGEGLQVRTRLNPGSEHGKATSVCAGERTGCDGGDRSGANRGHGSGVDDRQRCARLAVDEVGPRDVRGELGEVLTGAAEGRRDDEELTLFKSLGLAAEDLAAVEHLYRRATETGSGQRVEL